MRALQAKLGCDHRAVFTTTYLELTKTARDALIADPSQAQVAALLLPRGRALRQRVLPHRARAMSVGEEVPEAWRIAFETAASDDVDWRFRTCCLGSTRTCRTTCRSCSLSSGLRTHKGTSRKPDHDHFNAVLSAGYEPVVTAVRDRYDPAMGLTNPDFLPADDVAGLELVREWRENVYRNAERLVNAKTRRRARAGCRVDPGVRGGVGADRSRPARPRATAPTRDAYCKQQLGL